MIDKDDMKIRRHLKVFVRSRLDDLGMTEAELSRTVDVNQSQIHRLVHGMHTPSLSFAIKIAKALQCDLNSLAPESNLVES